MTGFAPRKVLPIGTGTLAVGSYSLRITRQLARARSKIGNRGLYRIAAELDDIAVPRVEISAEGLRPRSMSRQVPGEVVHFARDLMRLLPNSAPAPALVTDSDGALSFEWTGFNERVLSISVSPDGMLVYRGRLGSRRRISGAEPLAVDLPPIIRHALLEVRA